MTVDQTTETLHISGSDIHAFRMNEHYFKLPYISETETAGSIREVEIDGRYTFTGLCIEDLNQNVGCILDLSNGILLELTSL